MISTLLTNFSNYINLKNENVVYTPNLRFTILKQTKMASVFLHNVTKSRIVQSTNE